MKVTIQDLSKAFGSRDIFKNFSLEVDSGQRLCVCGPNGTGKSTFLRMIAGIDEPDSGKVIFPKGCRVGYVEQELSDKSLAMPLMEYVLTGVHDWNDFWREWEKTIENSSDDNNPEQQHKLEALMHRQAELETRYGYNPEQRAKEVLSGLGFDQDKWTMPLKELSGGWRERAKLAAVLTAGADVLLLDEPTNHLDIEAVEWLEDFLLAYKGALIFVAHDRVFMDKIGNYILYLGSNKPVYRKTNYSGFLRYQEEYNMQREREAKALQDEYDRKMAFVERFRAKATKARQASSHQKMAKKLEKELEDYKPEPKRKELNFSWPQAPHSEKLVLSAADLVFHFPDGYTPWPPLSFSIYRGNRIALAGPNGCGKSTLLKIIAGDLEKSGGSISKASQIRMGWYAQHQMELLNGDATVLAEIRRLSDPKLTEEELMSVLGLFLLGQNYFERKVATLSGGEKSRLVLATLFLKKCNFLLLDEPTNNLDIESREALARALKHFDGTLLMIAHDRWLLSEVGAEAWALGKNGITQYSDIEKWDTARKGLPLQGNPQKVAELNVNSREEQKKVKREEAEKRNILHRKLKPLQEKYDKLESALENLLNTQAQVEKTLADPETYADLQKSNELLSQYKKCTDQAERMMDTLAKLEEEIEIAKNG